MSDSIKTLLVQRAMALVAILTIVWGLTEPPNFDGRAVGPNVTRPTMGHGVTAVAAVAKPLLDGVAEQHPIGAWSGHAGCWYFTAIVGPDMIGCTDGYGEVQERSAS